MQLSGETQPNGEAEAAEPPRSSDAAEIIGTLSGADIYASLAADWQRRMELCLLLTDARRDLTNTDCSGFPKQLSSWRNLRE